MTRSAFCALEKIQPTTFASWIKKVGGELHVAAPKLVPLQIDDCRSIQVDGFEVEYPNGVRLRLGTLPSTEDLSRIIHLYREPCFR